MVVVCAQGSNIYLERAGDLTLLLAEKDHAQGSVRCFKLAEGALFVEAAPVTDISRRITAFQYELVPSQGPGRHMYLYLHPGEGRMTHVAHLCGTINRNQVGLVNTHQGNTDPLDHTKHVNFIEVVVMSRSFFRTRDGDF